jgi:hypothetical protein
MMTNAIARQYTDAILIVRINPNGTRRTVGTTFAQSVADKTCIALARAPYNRDSVCEYVTERNAKYTFDDANRVTGVR